MPTKRTTKTFPARVYFGSECGRRLVLCAFEIDQREDGALLHSNCQYAGCTLSPLVRNAELAAAVVRYVRRVSRDYPTAVAVWEAAANVDAGPLVGRRLQSATRRALEAAVRSGSLHRMLGPGRFKGEVACYTDAKWSKP